MAKICFLHPSIDVKFIFDSARLGLFSSANNILQIADVALRVVFLLFLPCFYNLAIFSPSSYSWNEWKYHANPATDEVCVENRILVLNSCSSPKTRIVLRKTSWSISLFLSVTESQCNSPQLTKLQFTLQFILLNRYPWEFNTLQTNLQKLTSWADRRKTSHSRTRKKIAKLFRSWGTLDKNKEPKSLI